MIDEKKLIMHLNNWLFTTELNSVEYKTIEECIKAIEEQPQADKWIPCEERLPSEGTEVLVTIEEIDDCKYTQTSWLQDGQWVIKKTPFEPKVIAWMPKPQPYKKEGESNAST